MEKPDREYIISGKAQSGPQIAIIVLILVTASLITAVMVQLGFPPIPYVFLAAMAAATVAGVIFHNLFYKIRIQKDGFYCRTNPFDGKYYSYCDVTCCRLTEERRKVGSAGNGTGQIQYLNFLVFTDTSNKTRKILYNKALFEGEMQILVSRIQQAQTR